jgi:hypothetical protein
MDLAPREIEPEVVDDEESAAAAAVTEMPKFGEFRSPMQMLDAKPGMYTISDFTNVLEGTQDQIQNSINTLVESGELEEGEYEGQAVYWPPDLELDLESNIVGISLRFPLNNPEGAASRAVSKKGIYKEMLFVKQENLIGKTKLKYVPLWRVPITEKKLFKKGLFKLIPLPIGRKKKIRRYIYINGMTGQVIEYKRNHLLFHDDAPDISKDMRSIPDSKDFEEVPPNQLRATDLKPLISRTRAVSIVESKVGARISLESIPTICFLPIWSFTVKDVHNDLRRRIWVDGTYGSIVCQDPTGGLTKQDRWWR